MAAKSLLAQMQSGVGSLSKLTEEQLEAELGRRLQMTREGLQEATPLSTAKARLPVQTAALAAGPMNVLRKLAREFINRLKAQFYSLICNKKDPDNAKVKAALGDGVAGLGYVIAGVLAVNLGLLPAIATAVGTLLARRIIDAGVGTFCTVFKP